MSITVGANIDVMNALNHGRRASIELNSQMEKLSSGSKINHGGDDPSGLAIGAQMKAHLRGLSTAIDNMQDGVNLLRFVDGGYEFIQDHLLRIQELAIRGANQATMNTEVGQIDDDPIDDTRKIYKEIVMSVVEINNVFSIYDSAAGRRFDPGRFVYNGKQIFGDEEFSYDPPNTDGRSLQIGADNDSNHKLDVIVSSEIDKFKAIQYYRPLPGNTDSDTFTAIFKQYITTAKTVFEDISDKRAEIGIQENRIISAINDATTEMINVSSARSKIMDADMAVELVGYAKAQMFSQGAAFAFSKANVKPEAIYDLLDSAGLNVMRNSR